MFIFVKSADGGIVLITTTKRPKESGEKKAYEIGQNLKSGDILDNGTPLLL